MTLDVEWEAPDWTERAVPLLAPAEPKVRRWDTPGAMAQAIHLDRADQQTPALEMIDSLLMRVADNDAAKAMIFAPPQSGKSSRVTRAFVLLLLSTDPRLRIAIVSSMADLAVATGRALRTDADNHPELGINRRADSDAAGRWETVEGGGVYCTSIGGPLTGRAVDLLIVDDPVKDRQSAESAVVRAATWDWWENVAKVRARKTILIQTRWHTDDLAGRLLVNESGEWAMLSIPAVAELDDPLGRAVGEELVTPVWEPGHYLAIQKTTSSYTWNALFQQRPTAAEGGLFKRGDWCYWTFGRIDNAEALSLDGVVWPLRDCRRFMTVDLAASTRTSADYTVAAAWAIPPSGDLVLLDWVRDRVVATDHAGLINPLRQRWLGPYDVVHIEKMFETSVLSHQLGRMGIPIEAVKPDGQKWTRALPYASLTRQRRVWLPKHADQLKLDSWINEHADFAPNAHRDDQVDNGSMATKIIEDHWLPPLDAAVEQAYAARKSADDIPDPMGMRW